MPSADPPWIPAVWPKKSHPASWAGWLVCDLSGLCVQPTCLGAWPVPRGPGLRGPGGGAARGTL